MAGTLTVTAQKNPFMDGVTPTRLVLDWTATAGGAVSAAICSTYSAVEIARHAVFPQPSKVQGDLRQVETIPGALGVPATNPPTAGYVLTILDAYGYDILRGAGDNRSATVAEKVMLPSVKDVIDSELTVTISGAGNATQGRIIMDFDSLDVVSRN